MQGVFEKIKNLFTLFLIYLGIEFELINIFTYLMILDFILGTIKSFSIGDKFRFNSFVWGIVLKLVILSIPVIVAYMAKSLNLDFSALVTLTLQFLVINEGLSCLGHISTIITEKSRSKNKYINTFIDIIHKRFQSKLDKIIRFLENESK